MGAAKLFFERPSLPASSIWSHGPIAQLAERAPDKGEVPGSNPGRPTSIRGELAQLGERRLCKPEVTGSSPVFSTSSAKQLGTIGVRIKPEVDGQPRWLSTAG